MRQIFNCSSIAASAVEALAKAEVAFADLDRIAVTKGPGSFTGVRVGLAAARGIGIASGKPVIGIDRFSIYKALHTEQSDLLVVIQSKRAELFCQYFPRHSMPYKACMMTHAEIDAFVTAHPGIKIKGDTTPHAGNILAACAQLATVAIAENPEYAPCPLYLRAPDVTIAPGKITSSR